ncbi:hypothetical protein LWI29_025199 [Acer saccharum]|uniref:Ubiquitin-like domain-containing protein n=1 Tax=Acer saccharum TaxID=4024 RepID=A0AA39VA88_ACESA|nr:hypothetical protein LWI29_025199 [Acer saccharum]
MAKLKIAGTWSGDLQVELEQWTVPMLREEVAKQSSMLPETINLICAGKVLKDGDGSEKLSQLGIKNNAKILATRVSADEGKSLVAEEERSRRLTRVKAAAAALVERHADGSLPLEDFNIELEDQNRETIRFGTETDRRAMMMGLMLHANAKKLIRRQLYKDALEVLTMGEVIEFVQFKERLQCSNQYLMARVESPILQLKQNADNIEEEESVLESLKSGIHFLELSKEIGSKSLTFNEDWQSRQWWTPFHDLHGIAYFD